MAGLLCTGRDEGWSAVRRVLRSLVDWRVGARWYALALGCPIAVALVAVAVRRLVVGNDAEFRVETSTILLVPLGLMAGLFIGSLQEELGWRVFALPRLLDHLSSRGRQPGARCGLGVLAPSRIRHGRWRQERAPLAAFLVSVVALSVLYTWF